MFVLWAIPIGIVAGLLLGGRPEGLLAVRFRWAALAVGGLLVQVVLFTPYGDGLAGDLAPTIYVASTVAVFVAVLGNLRLRGMAIVAAGALANLLAIVSNGGAMPADPEALVIAGFSGPGEHTNSVVLAEPAFRPLTDIFALPASLPMANVFSVGDVLIGLGVAIVIAAAMRRRAGGES
ncbi:MAG TPA: DUF5317 family protein [Candidatus Sulfomarinibacteraceae bacterium]|nr:DUF5317 family protein [Candidatus Sulfomarinibacteraceae bacterium]